MLKVLLVRNGKKRQFSGVNHLRYEENEGKSCLIPCINPILERTTFN